MLTADEFQGVKRPLPPFRVGVRTVRNLDVDAPEVRQKPRPKKAYRGKGACAAIMEVLADGRARTREQIAEEAGLTYRTVRRAMAVLCAQAKVERTIIGGWSLESIANFRG